MKSNGVLGFTKFLVCVISIVSVRCQNQIEINQVLSFTSSNLSALPLVYSLPESLEPLSISVAFCTANSSSQLQFYVTNNTSGGTPGPASGTDVFQVTVEENGIGTAVLQSASVGGILAIDGSPGNFSFEMLVSNNGE